MTTDEWRQTYEQEGCVDLWVEEEFNSGSRLMVSSAASSCWPAPAQEQYPALFVPNSHYMLFSHKKTMLCTCNMYTVPSDTLHQLQAMS